MSDPFVTPWTIAYQALLSMGFPKQEYWLLLLLSHFSHVQLFATLWTVAHQSPQSVGFSWQEYWNGLLCPALGDLSDPGIKPSSLKSPALGAGSLPLAPPVMGFPGGSDGKESVCNAGDPRLIPGSGISPGEGNGNSLQYS